MKKPWHSRYFEISFFTAATAVFVSAVFLIMNNIDVIFKSLCQGFFWVIGIFTPVYIAVAVAFVLDPAVDFFQNETGGLFRQNKKGAFKKRIRGASVTYVIIFLLIGAGIRLTLKSFGPEEVGDLSAVIEDFVYDMKNFLFGIKRILDDTGLFSNTDYVFNSIIARFSDLSQRFVFSAAVSVTSFGGKLLDFAIGLVAAFYFLVEKERLLFRINETAEVFFPQKVYSCLKNAFSDIDEIFSGYVSGQLIDAMIMTVMVSVAMWMLGIRYFMIIGIISGIANLIPYVGAAAAFVLSVAAAAAQGTPVKALYAAIMVLGLQQIDAMVIVPKIVGSRVRLHPVLVIVSLSVFGSMFGVAGMIIAVPVTAFIKKKFDRIYMKKKFSS
ncbi:AI-2E family transporter [Lachnospiraceae bacterium NSJ-143]|nr:AI-2E family transporter [Lachnospiraceae bacterium NSJ-143]